MVKVLLTGKHTFGKLTKIIFCLTKSPGGSGFIAAHCLDQLINANHTVITTVRTQAKATHILEAYPSAASASRLVAHVVPDIADPAAFDALIQSTPDIDVVLHTASPFHFNWEDPQRELVDPAVVGTTGVLKALHKYAKGVKRVVVTSSFASILDEDQFYNPDHTFTEKSWNPAKLEDIHNSKATAYRVSKTLAEKAAWEFVEKEKPSFDLVTVCPPLVLGPVVHHLATLDSINTSNARIVALLRGEWKDEIPSQGPVSIWIDVRDVAKAHVLAIDKPEVGGKRLFTTAGYFDHQQIARIVREKFPEFADKLPKEGVKGGELPDPNKTFKWDVSETDKLLGIKWRTVEESISDLVVTLKEKGV